MTDDIEDNVKHDPHLEAQWDAWMATNPLENIPDVTDDEVREAIIKDLSNVCKMTVGEYTLYQKWCEVHEKYPTQTVSTLFGDEVQMKDLDKASWISQTKDNIWFPESVDDYLNLQPELVYTKEAELSETWNMIRNFTSTMKNNSNIGRNLNYLVVDRKSGKYLGLICISSDFLDLTPRDKFIGWEREKKTQGHMINYTAIGSTIVPLQPLGYNYVGGKLLALLCLSDEVQYQWKKQYGDVLAGVTTTSLYGKDKAGGLSQYDNLKHWKKMGFSSGSVSYECTKPTIKLLLNWLAKNHTRKYFEWYGATKPSGQPYKRDHRNRSYTFAYSKLGIPKDLIKSEHHRGIYFSPLYTNTCEFLRGEITEKDLDKAFDTSYDGLNNLWKEKYAAKRIKSLKEQGRVSSERLFYDDLIYMSWEETKAKYLSQVGR
jgi:Domain of unknown function (DUF4338)